MKNLILFPSLLLALYCSAFAQQFAPNPISETSVISQPVVIEDDDWRFEGTQNLIFVPENRLDPNSRKIALHFFRFPAREKSNLPPVAFLGAGPGEPYSVEVFFDGERAEAWRYELNFVNQKRDVILINQRGNSEAPGLQISNFIYRWRNGGTLDRPLDQALRNKNRRESYERAIEDYEARGIDLKGYDILHFVDDIEAVRRHLKCPKIALIGNSFASQWAMGYIQRYPENVDRALFSGVEPLDHNYDDPDEIWKVLHKIERFAMADPKIAKDLPDIGLLEAFKAIVQRLEKQPQMVYLTGDGGKQDSIVVGVDDLRFNLTFRRAGRYRGAVETWPKYITEMYNGDFRPLAKASQGRVYNSYARMINPLFNNSLGVSKEREAKINHGEARRWLGDINDHYTSTRDVCPAPKVADAFRQHAKHDIPILLIQGDMDMRTPYGKSEFLMNFLNKGHLITVKRGFHNAKRALIFDNRELVDRIYHFMNLDFQKESFEDFKVTLPDTYELPAFKFWPIQGPALAEERARD